MKREQRLTCVTDFSFKLCLWETVAGFIKCKTQVSTADTLGNDTYRLLVLLFLNEIEYTYEEAVG